MSPRARSWLGGILGAAGLFAFFTGALFPGLSWLAWMGGGAAVVGLVLVVTAVVSVSREIGGNQARFEAMLRSEALPPKKDPPDGP
jgi:hypothetical protein